MIKVFIADDEPVIQTGMKTVIDWEAMGMEVTGMAGNGRDALAKILVQKPDILITDIRMPVMDGIKLAKEARGKLSDLKIVFLTGYSDFEYAKQAVKIGAADYLLKPVREQELIDVLGRLKHEIIWKNEESQNERQKNRLLKQNLPVIRYRCLMEFIRGAAGLNLFLDKAGTLDIQLEGPHYLMLAYSLDNYYQVKQKGEKEEELFKMTVINVAEELLGQVSCVTSFDSGEATIFFLVCMEPSVGQVVEVCREIQFFLKKHFGWSVTVGVGESTSRLEELGTSLKSAQKAAENKMFQGNNRIIMEQDSGGRKDQEKQDNRVRLYLGEEEEGRLTEKLELLRKYEMQEVLDDIFVRYLHDQKMDRRQAEQLSMNLISVAVKVLEEQNLSAEEALGEDYYFYEEIRKYETLEEMELWMKSVFNKALYAMEHKRGGKYKSIVVQGMEYGKAHYAEPISVADVSGAIFVSPNYFSKVFKEETGENFTEWLNQYRIDQAKKMMEDNPAMKVYEVASATGFGDYKYFAFIFKKYTGYTPTVYRELMQ